MSSSAQARVHRFKDEWLVPLVSRLPDAPLAQIEGWREEKQEFLSQALIDSQIVSFQMIASLIQNAYRIESVTVGDDRPDKAILSLVPEKVTRRHHVVPMSSDSRSISVAMANPLDPEATQDVESVTGRQVVPLFCPPGELHRLELQDLDPEAMIYDLARKFGATEKVEVLERESESESEAMEDPHAPGTVKAPVVKLVNGIIAQAARMGASDVHLDHEETSSVVRYRMDGVLKNMMVLPRYLASGPVVARIKIMAGLDISVRIRPQDGRAKLRVGEDTIGIRVSTLPSQNGEKVVLRILDEKSIQIPLEALGFHPGTLDSVRRLLRHEQGVMLVTGPTGSGKTTTLYAALKAMATEEVNVITVEDPVEYRLKGITQVQVNERQGLTFAAVLRSVLRQDPDVVLLGEIRDEETATVAIQAAQTGHLVLSTLHTNDTVSTVVRLADMGVEGFKLASSLLGVTAQRLVRKLCGACSEDDDPSAIPDTLRQAMERLGMVPRPKKSVGCPKCRFTGYKGRLPLIELLTVTDDVRAAIGREATAEEIQSAARADDALRFLDEDALWHLAEGHTTVSECEGFLNESRIKTLTKQAPTVKSEARVAAQPRVEAPAMRTLPHLHVVVAAGDDTLGPQLGDLDFEVEAFQDGAAVLGAVARTAPDILLVGPGLQTMDGAQVLRTLRSVMGHVDLPVVALGPDAAGGELVDDVVDADADAATVATRLRATVKRQGQWSAPEEVSAPPTPVDERQRVRALHDTGILDTPPEERFDRITRAATEGLVTPMSSISLVDTDRQWFKSRQGVSEPETPRDVSFCGHAINYEDGMVVSDARLDSRFAQNPLVDGGVRSYAGKPIRSPDGHVVGMMCVMDSVPHDFSEADLQRLEGLRDEVESELWGAATA